MNRVILMGRLTHDPELRALPNGTTVCVFDLAVERRFAKEGQQQADFLRCVAWKQTAEFLSRWFGKGKMIAVEGRIETRQWEENGRKKFATEIIVEQAHFCGKEETASNQTTNTSYVENGFTDLTDGESSEDDLPF